MSSGPYLDFITLNAYSLIAKDDMFWPVEQWPKWVQNMYFDPHKNNRDRYVLFSFFVKNGLPAAKARDYVLFHHGKHDGRNLYQYDAEAFRQMDWLVQKWDQTPSYFKYPVWDMISKETH